MHVANGVNFDKLAHPLNRRLQRTNKPFDTYGLYRAVRLLPVQPRSRGARRSLRTFPVDTLHPRFPFNV